MFRAAGRSGYVDAIRGNIRLAERLHERVREHPEFEPHAVNLSITTFRFVPRDLAGTIAGQSSQAVEAYLDTLNQAVLAELQAGGKLFLSNAVVDGRYLLRPGASASCATPDRRPGPR